MYSEPSWGPCLGQGPLKWTEIGPTNDPWMIWDEFETFRNDSFCKLKPEYIFKKIILFLGSRIFIQNKYSFFKISRIFIQKIIFLNPEYSFKKIFIFLKSRIFIQTKYSFFSTAGALVVVTV